MSDCLGCGGPLRERQGLNTCDSPRCPGNLHKRLDAFWGITSAEAGKRWGAGTARLKALGRPSPR